MIWEVKNKSFEKEVKTRFAFFPVKCQGSYIREYWVWLERYYVFTTLNTGYTTLVHRYLCRDDAVKAYKKYISSF